MHTLRTTKQTRKNVANALLWGALDSKKIVSLDWALQGELPKTKQAFTALHKAGLDQMQVNLFIPAHDLLTAASFANIPSVRVLFFDAVNSYDLADTACWVVLKKDLEGFKEMVARWI